MRALKTTFLISLCAVLAFANGLLVFANDAAFEGVGGSLRPMRGEHASIRMVHEHVQIELHGDFYRTRVDFEFQNTSSRPVTVTMGFPERGSGDVNAAAARRRTTFRRFATWVDDRPATARRIVANADEQTYQAYWTKQVAFAPRGRRRVRVEYESPMSGMSGTVGDPFTWRAPYEFTGGNWQGQVAESRLTVRAVAPGIYILRAQQSTNNSQDVIQPQTVALTREGDSFTHTWRNWEAEASFDLGVLMTVPGAVALEGAGEEFDSFDAFRQTDESDGRRYITVPANGVMPLENYRMNVSPPVMRRGSRLFIAHSALSRRLETQAEEAGRRDAVETIYDRSGTPTGLRAGRHTFGFRAGSATMRHNSNSITMPAAAFRLGDSDIYVPLDAVMTALGGTARPGENGGRVSLEIPAFW